MRVDVDGVGIHYEVTGKGQPVQMIASAANVNGRWRYERIEDAGHRMQLDAPEEVTRLLIDFLPV